MAILVVGEDIKFKNTSDMHMCNFEKKEKKLLSSGILFLITLHSFTSQNILFAHYTYKHR